MTKEYLKMADIFDDASQEYIEQLLYSGFMSKDSCELIAHAVSSHDELVADVELLRKFKDVATSAMKSTRAVLITALADYPEGGVDRDVLQLRIEAISMLID